MNAKMAIIILCISNVLLLIKLYYNNIFMFYVWIPAATDYCHQSLAYDLLRESVFGFLISVLNYENSSATIKSKIVWIRWIRYEQYQNE